MKKKLFSAIAAAVCALCCAVGLVACGDNEGGNGDGTTNKVAEFVRVTDGVFASAGYTKGSKTASAKQLTARDADGGLGENLDSLYTDLKNDTNLTPVGGNLNYIKCDTLYWGANLAGLVKSLALTVGEEVFSSAYDLSSLGMPLYSAKISDGDWYTLQGVGRSGGAVVSAIEINFREYADGKFLFKLAQYEKSGGVAMLSFSCYDSDGAAFTVTLRGNESVSFSAYDTAYSVFAVQQCRLVIFEKTQYVSGSADAESIMKFAKDNLGFTNNTYSTLSGLSTGKTLSDEQVKGVTAQMMKNYYINPYSPYTGDKKAVESIYISPSLSLKAGESSVLSVTITPENAVYDRLEWSSSDESVATVSNGKVTAVSKGKATITVITDNGKSADCAVTVTEKQTTEPDNGEVKEITLSDTALTLYYVAVTGSKATLNATVSPADAASKIKWTATDSDYVVIEGEGASVTLTAGDIGILSTANVTVTATVDGKSADCEVTVKKVGYVSVWLEEDPYAYNKELEIGEKINLKASVTPEDISEYYRFEWSSSDETVATVTNDGEVTMLGYGEAEIRVVAGGEHASFDVFKEAPPAEVESVTLNKTSLTLTVGKSEKLTATVLPANAENKSVIWASSDSSVASVNDYTGVVYAAKKGTAIISATAANGVHAECTVTVNAAPEPEPEISLNKTELTLETDGDETLTVSVAAGIYGDEFFWRSSSSDVATVDKNGRVRAVGEGTATITVITGDMHYMTTCTVTVVAPAEKRLTYTKIEENGEVTAYSVRGIGTLADADSVVIPAQYKGKPVISVGEEALWDGKMTHLTISDGVKIISDGAFAWCERLVSVTVPDSVERIGYGAFYQCNALEEIFVPFIGESADATDNATLGYVFSYRQDDAVPQSLAKITVRGGTVIPERAFSSLTSVTEIVLPDNVTDIGREAFAYCSSLEKILLPATLKKIGIGAFFECTSLVNAGIPDGVESIAINAFNGCTALEAISIPASVESIGTEAFRGCNSLEEITVPYIGENAAGTGSLIFGYLFGAKTYSENATSVPASLKKVTVLKAGVVAVRAFYGCASLEEVVLPEGVYEIKVQAFYGCGLKKAVVPKTVRSIESSAFGNCNSLTELTVPFIGGEKGTNHSFLGYIFGQQEIGDASQCIPATLTKVTVTGDIALIANIFNYCGGIKELRFEGNITAIERNAFSGCSALRDIYYNGTQSEWDGITKAQNWDDGLSFCNFHFNEEE